MINKKDIKVGLKFRVYSSEKEFSDFEIKKIDGLKCECERINVADCYFFSIVPTNTIFEFGEYLPTTEEKSQNYKCDQINRKSEQVNHPIHYSWLKDLCGVEPLDICRHLDFNIGNSLKYLLRKDKVDGNKTKIEKRVEDLRKAIFYIEDEIKLLENGKEQKNSTARIA